MARKDITIPAKLVRPGDVAASGMLIQRVDATESEVTLYLYGAASGRRQTLTLQPHDILTVVRMYDPHENPFHDLG